MVQKALAHLPDIGCSSATVRNIMADLEAMGLVKSPHTSAGRIPTAQGYRVFVDSLLVTEPLEDTLIERYQKQYQQQLHDVHSKQAMISTASSMLSGMTHLAGMVTISKHNQGTLRHIEFLPLSEGRILVILVLNEAEVQNRVIKLDKTYSANELLTMANCINAHYAGHDISSVHHAIMTAMQQDKSDLDQAMQSVLSVAYEVFGANDAEAAPADCVIAGENHLFGAMDEGGVDQLQRLFQAFNDKRDILHVFERSMSAEGVQIFIGEESGVELFEGCSIVSAPYEMNHERIGVLGVIGPKRMPYQKVISVVDMSAKLLSMALNSKTVPPYND